MHQHYWHAPEIPAGTPLSATVTIKSDCNQRLTMPVWQMQDWQARQPVVIADPCPVCLAAAKARHPAGKAVSTDKHPA